QGDFDVRVRIEPGDCTVDVEAGLVVRETADEGSRCIAALVRPGQKQSGGRIGYAVRSRSTPGGQSQIVAERMAAGEPGAWVRLRRVGDTVSAWHSADGARWKPLSEVKMP